MKRIFNLLLFTIAVTTLQSCAAPEQQTAAPEVKPTLTVTSNTAELEKQIIEPEKKTWDLFTSRKFDEAAKANAPGYQAIYYGKVKPDAEATEDNKYIDIKNISFSDWKATFPTKDVAILTYRYISTSSFKGNDTSGTYVTSSVWVKLNGDWKTALFHETKASEQTSAPISNK